MDVWAIILFFGSAIIFGTICVRSHLTLVDLLVKYGRTPTSGLSTWAVYYNLKDAQKLVKELGDKPEAMHVKTALRKTDVFLFLAVAVPLLTAILWVVISAITSKPN